MSHKQRQPRRGVVLLVVLGMLSLFSVLVVSYVVFSAQMSEGSFANNQKRLNELPPEPVFDNAIISLLVGTNDPKSAAFGMSMMEDFWGNGRSGNASRSSSAGHTARDHRGDAGQWSRHVVATAGRRPSAIDVVQVPHQYAHPGIMTAQLHRAGRH